MRRLGFVMNMFVISVMILLSINVVSASQYAYYNFEEGSGSSLVDSWGSNNGVINGMTWDTTIPSFNISGDGESYSGFFNSSAVDFQNGISAISKNNDFSVSLWLKINDPTQDSTAKFVFDSERSNVDAFAIAYRNSVIKTSLYDGAYISPQSGSINGSYNHIVYVYDSANGTAKLYINSILQTGTSPAGSSGLDYPVAKIGGRADNASNRFLDGYVDELKIWDNVLTKDDVVSLYNEGSATSNFTVELTEADRLSTLEDLGVIIPSGSASDWDNKIREKAPMIYFNNMWMVFYAGYNSTAEHSEGDSKIGLATGSTPTNLTKQGVVIDWMTPEHSFSNIQDPAITIKDGILYMAAEIQNTSGVYTYITFWNSSDGIMWNHMGDFTIADSWATVFVGTPVLLYEQNTGYWHLWYEGSNGNNLAGYANGTSLLSLTDYGSVLPNAGTLWHSSMQDVVRINDTYYCYGHRLNEDKDIALYTSSDRVNWVLYDGDVDDSLSASYMEYGGDRYLTFGHYEQGDFDTGVSLRKVVGSTGDFQGYYSESGSCVPDWACTGYATSTCLVDDTTTAACNAVTDNNACGESYSGNYTEFSNQTGVCDYCTPSWSCAEYVCTQGNIEECGEVNDTNNCYETTNLSSDAYSGDLSEYEGACTYGTFPAASGGSSSSGGITIEKEGSNKTSYGEKIILPEGFKIVQSTTAEIPKKANYLFDKAKESLKKIWDKIKGLFIK